MVDLAGPYTVSVTTIACDTLTERRVRDTGPLPLDKEDYGLLYSGE